MWLGHHFQGQKVKGQGHQAAFLLNPALTREVGAAVTVRTYWAWEVSPGLQLRCICSAAREALGRQRGQERGWGIYCVATRTAC